MSLPIFTDEAIYTRWSQIARHDAGWRFISLSDGKQPLFIWLDMILMRFIHDPLLSGRIVSVLAGFFTMIGLFLLGREIFRNRWIGILSAGFYIIYPFALVYDRMALYDSLVGMFAVWSLYLWVLLVRKTRLDTALILGMVIGGSVLTKTSGFFNLYLAPSLLIIFDWSRKEKIKKLLNFIALSILVVVLSYSYYSILRLSPFFHIINDKNMIFVYSFHDWINHPLSYFVGNIKGLFDWFTTYLTLPFSIAIVLSFLISLKFTREKILLFFWFILPFLALALFGKVLYPRFIFFMTLSLFPLLAFLIYEIFNKLNNKYIFYILLFLFSFTAIRNDYLILTDFANAPIPKPDLDQYINDWPAGGGVKEIISYLEKQAEERKIYIASPGTFGSLPTFSVEIYLGDNKNIEKRGIYPVPLKIPPDLLERSKKIPVYVFFSNQKEFEQRIRSWPLVELIRIKKGKGEAYSVLYRVVPR